MSHQGLIDPRSGKRACNSAYACRAGEVLVVTKYRTLPFSKVCPNPLKNWAKTGIYQKTREFLQLEGQRRLHSSLCHPPTRLVLFLVTTSILQAYAELHALSPLHGSISPWSYLVWKPASHIASGFESGFHVHVTLLVSLWWALPRISSR